MSATDCGPEAAAKAEHVRTDLGQSARFGKLRPGRQTCINILMRPKIVKRHSRSARQRKEEDEN